jgi:hypothetical protein
MTMKEKIDAFLANHASFRASEFAALLGVTRAVAVAYLLGRTYLTCNDLNEHDPVFEKRQRWENNEYDGIQCTCKRECDSDCKGQCGCKACHTAYQDFLSME